MGMSLPGKPVNTSGGLSSGGFQIAPEAQTALIQGAFSFLMPLLMQLMERLLKPKPQVSVPASERPLVDDLPDDKIIPAGPRPVPSAPVVTPQETPLQLAARLGYTSLKVNVQKAQYNRELFPGQYTQNNPFGLYQPKRQDVYNRWSKIWMDATPFKGAHGVQTEEGEKDGILWEAVWVWVYNGQTTIQRANRAVTRDTIKGAGRPIDVVTGESVGLGMSAWDASHSYLSQTNVGDNEGNYEVHAEIPKLGLVSETFAFRVS